MSASSAIAPKSLGRFLLLLGMAVALGGVIVFAVLTMAAGVLHTPWYAPALATLGAGGVLWSLRRRPTVTRGIMLVLFTALAALAWWFVVFYTKLPPYAGPAAAGRPFPDFAAELGDGKTFRWADLIGDQDTVLVFFRGRW